jgi:4-diphosphocytidyl-2-C-methyl-D-erythritol kinase
MFKLQAPAKINWFLKILSKRPDGYHNLFSLMQKITLYDTLVFELIPKGIEVTCTEDIKMQENLVYKTALLLQRHTSIQKGARIHVIKRIPLQAGLGGGSTDAATTLIGLNRLWRLNLSEKQLFNIASAIGSDVPFFLSSPLSLVMGRGEIVKPLYKKTRRFWLLILKPPYGISTKKAYSLVNINRTDRRDLETLLQETLEALQYKDKTSLMYVLQNDLEEPVFRLYPELKEIKNRLIEAGSLAALLAGSGSSVFGVFNSFEEAYTAEKNFKGTQSIITETILPVY